MGRYSKLATAAEVLVCALVVLAASPLPAYAYVDPSVMTYTIQAVAGAAVALGAVLGVALRRTRRFLFRIFKIDENANKIVEPDVAALGGSEGQRAEMRAEADEEARGLKERLAHGRPAKRLSWPKRFIRALICCAFLVWTITVFPPIDLVAANADSLLFNIFDIMDVVLFMGIAITIVAALIISFIPGRAFDVILTLIVAVGIGCYVQMLFLNEQLPLADGRPLQLSIYKMSTLISAVVWIAIVIVLLIFNAKKKPFCRAFILVTSLALFIVQGVSMASVISDESGRLSTAEESPTVMSTYGINEVGSEANVTVFVLDTFDTGILDILLEEDPNILDEYTGFTYFHNSTGSMIPTRYGVPFLLTNVMIQEGQDYDDYLNNRYDRSTFLQDIADQGYEITIYSDSIDVNKLEPYAANIFPENHREFNDEKLWFTLERMSLYRVMPWIVKPFFWFYTDELNASSVDSYYIDDALYGTNLQTEGLTVSDDADKTFRFIHMLGAHYPYTLNEEGERVTEDQTDAWRQSRGSFNIVTEYIRQLKELGLYDQSTIIVTADHGYWDTRTEPLDSPTSPLLLVKPPETAEEASQPIKVSEVPTGHLDYAATVIDLVGGDSSAYGPTVFEVKDGPRDRYYWMTEHNDHVDLKMLEYVIQGHALDMDNWHLTGEEIEVNQHD